MRYDPRMVQPMREELTRIGFEELTTPEAVDAALTASAGTVLMMVNSVCGCAAGRARPGVALALRQGAGARPERLTTVFAGMDVEATEQARSHFPGYPPSSPCIALFKDGRLVHMMERRDIEPLDGEEIATALQSVFTQHCPSPRAV